MSESCDPFRSILEHEHYLLNFLKVQDKRLFNIHKGYIVFNDDRETLNYHQIHVQTGAPVMDSATGKIVYPVTVMTTSNIYPRMTAVCRRPYDDFVKLNHRVDWLYRRMSRRHYRVSFIKRMLNPEKSPVRPLQWVPRLVDKSTEKRALAIREFCKSLFADPRTNSFAVVQLFFFSSLSIEQILGNEELALAGNPYVGEKVQDYERDIFPKDLTVSEILNLTLTPTSMVDEVGYDPLSTEDFAPTNIWKPVQEELVPKRKVSPTKQIEKTPSCRDFLEIDLRDAHSESAKDSPSTIRLNHRSAEYQHAIHIERSYLNFGHEERVKVLEDGRIEVFDPKPIEVGSCPDKDECIVAKRRKLRRKNRRLGMKTSATDLDLPRMQQARGQAQGQSVNVRSTQIAFSSDLSRHRAGDSIMASSCPAFKIGTGSMSSNSASSCTTDDLTLRSAERELTSTPTSTSGAHNLTFSPVSNLNPDDLMQLSMIEEESDEGEEEKKIVLRIDKNENEVYGKPDWFLPRMGIRDSRND